MGVVAVVVDNGEPLLERCLQSLSNQSINVRIVVAPGPRTDLRVAEEYADRVLEPVDGIGRARVNAILSVQDEYILSCDSDTIYHPRYAEVAVNALQLFPAVRAGTVLPHEGEETWLGLIEGLLSTKAFCYEFALAFRRSDFLQAGIHLEDYSSPRADIGAYVCSRLMPPPIPTMVCRTRLPTYYAKRLVNDYIYPAIGASTPITVASSIVALNELIRRARP